MNFETSSALGMHVNGVWSREDDDDDDDGYDDDAYEKEKGEGWVRLTNTVGAKFCAGANVRQANTSVFSATSRFGLNAIGATPLASAATNTAAADNDEGAGGSGNSNANNSSDADFALVVADTSSDLFIYTYS